MEMTVALVSEVFHGPGAEARLADRLGAARRGGAALAMLPELPLQAWCPAARTVRDEDAEPPGGPRELMLRDAARRAGIGVLGGTIARDPATGRRHNTALLVDARGEVRGTYRKVHLPQEPGFWEADHYAPGRESPSVVDGFPLRLGVQLCSDVNRPAGSHVLAGLGAEAILVPRATEASTFDPWRLVLRASALTSGAWVLSVNRPAPEGGAPLGGPSIVVAPDGSVAMETMAPLAFASLRAGDVRAARRGYPGYLALPADAYAAWWSAVPVKDIHPPA